MKQSTKHQERDFLGIGNVGRSLRELGENVLHVGLGALATAEEESSRVVRELMEKGKDRDGRDATLVEKGVDRAAEGFKSMGGRIERGVKGGTQTVLNRFGIPTHDQIDELISRVDRLNKKVDELRK